MEKIGLVNSISGRQGEVGAGDLSNEQMVEFLKGDLGVRDLVKKEDKRLSPCITKPELILSDNP